MGLHGGRWRHVSGVGSCWCSVLTKSLADGNGDEGRICDRSQHRRTRRVFGERPKGLTCWIRIVAWGGLLRDARRCLRRWPTWHHDVERLAEEGVSFTRWAGERDDAGVAVGDGRTAAWAVMVVGKKAEAFSWCNYRDGGGKVP